MASHGHSQEERRVSPGQHPPHCRLLGRPGNFRGIFLPTRLTFVAVLIALGLAGALSARIGGSNIRHAVLRVVIGGALGLAFTYGIGHLFGTATG
jgi:membrane protein DedA with SNARE-associated domain